MGYRLAQAMRDRGARTVRVRRTGVLLWLLLLLATLAALVMMNPPDGTPYYKEDARP